MERSIVVVLLALVGGFMVFDGARAFLTGEYVTPSKGRYVDQLGPWSSIVKRVGIEPKSTLMKTLFIVTGALHLAAAIVLAVGGSSWPAIIAAIAGLWYLPFGSMADVVVLALIGFTSLRP